MLSPYAPNEGADLVVQLLAVQLQRQLGQGVVVDRRGAEGGSVAAWIASRANADGYTWFVGTVDELVAAATYRKLGFDAQRDLQPVTSVAQAPLALLVQSQRVDAENFVVMRKRMQARPGQLVFGSPGPGCVQYLAIEELARLTRSRVSHATYRTPALALADLRTGKIDAVLDVLGAASVDLQAGRVRALVLAAPERAQAFSDVPSAQELGLTDWGAALTYGVWAVAGTSSATLERMAKEVAAAVRVPEVNLACVNFGANAQAHSPTQFALQVQRELQRWQQQDRSSAPKK